MKLRLSTHSQFFFYNDVGTGEDVRFAKNHEVSWMCALSKCTIDCPCHDLREFRFRVQNEGCATPGPPRSNYQFPGPS